MSLLFNSSSSSSEDENDMELWHEQRRRIKQGIEARNQAARAAATAQKRTPNSQEIKPAARAAATAHKRTPNLPEIKPIHISTKEAQKTPNLQEIKPVDKPTKETNVQENEKKVEPTKERKEEPYEEKLAIHKDEKNIQLKKTDEKAQITKEKNYILINKHISPTETVAEFVLIPSPEFDRLTAESKAAKESGISKETTKRNVREAWVELQVEEQKASKGGNQGVLSISKPEEKKQIHVKPVTQVEKELFENKGIDASNNTLQPSRLIQHIEAKEEKAKLSKKELEQQKVLNEKIKAKKTRIQQRLESVKRERETRTVGGRICIAAPETPVVYDLVSCILH